MREMNGGTSNDIEEESAEDAAGGSQEDVTEAREDMDRSAEESEDLTGQPVPEEDFDGTHEEYEEYLKEFESESDGSDSEEIVIDPEEIDVSEDVETQYGLASLPDFGESDIEALMDLLDSLSFSVNGEQDVLNIITEEADAYFSGQKSAADVADIIQSRVSVYLKENE